MEINNDILTSDAKDKHCDYKVEIANEIGDDNYYYIYSNLTSNQKISEGKKNIVK